MLIVRKETSSAEGQLARAKAKDDKHCLQRACGTFPSPFFYLVFNFKEREVVARSESWAFRLPNDVSDNLRVKISESGVTRSDYIKSAVLSKMEGGVKSNFSGGDTEQTTNDKSWVAPVVAGGTALVAGYGVKKFLDWREQEGKPLLPSNYNIYAVFLVAVLLGVFAYAIIKKRQ